MGKNRLIIITTSLLITITTALFAQGEKPQNIYRVTVNSRYVIENGERTSKYYAIGQLISDSLGRLHTEIDYNWKTRYPDNYRWHYFDGQTKVKTDYFFKENLKYFKVFSHNANHQLETLSLFLVTDSDTTLAVREEHTYDDQGNRVRSIGYNQKGKRGFRVRYKYDDNNTEIQRKVRGKRAIPSDSIMSLKRVVEYDTLNRIVNELVEVQKYDMPKETKHKFYKYDDKGNVVEKVITDKISNKTIRKEYVYRRDNRLQGLRIYDSNDNLLDYQAWRYEIYRTANRTHRVFE
jgi:hypothetical protein